MAITDGGMIETYRSFDIWKRRDARTLVRYRCFEDCSIGRFCVQSADFYRPPVTNDQIQNLEKQFIELLMEQSPFDRSGSCGSIEEAISEFDKTFE
jgi:hypothetical protein